ncbi:hypothetical protein [Paenibacillus macerans]|uniref:hypothetical protein n=1 Tax=Paenibacillus macerans TaxID=44252 RepID=UPI003D31A5FB
MLLKFTIKNFIEEKKLNNVSSATMERYVGTTSEFHSFCVEEQIVNVEEVSPTTIKEVFTPLPGEKKQQYCHQE